MTNIQIVSMQDGVDLIVHGICSTQDRGGETVVDVTRRSLCTHKKLSFHVGENSRDDYVHIVGIKNNKAYWLVPEHERWICVDVLRGVPATKKFFLYVKIPHCLFMIPINKKYIDTHSKIWMIDVSTKYLTSFPYGNVFASAVICWGTKNLWTHVSSCISHSHNDETEEDLDVCDLKTATTMLTSLFFDTPFNADVAYTSWINVLAKETPTSQTVAYVLTDAAHKYVGKFRTGQFNEAELANDSSVTSYTCVGFKKAFSAMIKRAMSGR